MTADDLRSALGAEPFEPFSLTLVTGQQLPVPHPEFLFVHPKGRSVFVADAVAGGRFVDVMHITSIDFDGDGTAGG